MPPQLRPLDPAFPIDGQLALDATPVILVNLVTLDQADEQTDWSRSSSLAAASREAPRAPVNGLTFLPIASVRRARARALRRQVLRVERSGARQGGVLPA